MAVKVAVGFNVIRYPGGKRRLIQSLVPLLPSRDQIAGRLVEPFVGSGAAFFAVRPRKALLSDINGELIDLYRGIRLQPQEVWTAYQRYPSTRAGYYRIRGLDPSQLDLTHRAARTLYLNRTCFKGMWRHNRAGGFNVGYGGEDRRWVIAEDSLIAVSRRLRVASLKCRDFEETIDTCDSNDFVFLDPPYRAGEREMLHDHYAYGKFDVDDHRRLGACLQRASGRGVRWAMTTSAHHDIVTLFKRCMITPIARGTGKSIGVLTRDSGEVLITNYRGFHR